MTVAQCTCGGIAPGYPHHETQCATTPHPAPHPTPAEQTRRQQQHVRRTAEHAATLGLPADPWARVAS